jgi:hypothetical protein
MTISINRTIRLLFFLALALSGLQAHQHIARPHPLPFQKAPPFKLHEGFVPAPLSAKLKEELKKIAQRFSLKY